MFRKTLLTIASFAVLASFSPQSMAGIWENGAWQNGLWSNGVWQNGVWDNAIATNGWGKNGSSYQGLNLRGLTVSVGGSDGVKVISIELPR